MSKRLRSLTLAGGNLNFGRTADEQRADVGKMRERGADIVATCEDVRAGFRERIVPNGRCHVVEQGAILASLTRAGLRIGWRRFRWVDLDEPGLPKFRAVSGHMPPHRFRRLLGPIYGRRLRKLLRRGPKEWAVHADWNQLLRDDPAGLVKHFDAVQYGIRIDGWIVSPGLAKYVSDFEFSIPRPHGDNHAYTSITLTWWGE